ncbi:MAG: glycosyltransferase [Myxococcota bacterium]
MVRHDGACHFKARVDDDPMQILMSEALPYFESDIRVGAHHFAENFARLGNRVGWVSPPLHALGFVRGALGSDAHRRAWRNGRRSVTSEGAITEWRPVTALPHRHLPIVDSEFTLKNQLRFSLPRGHATLRRMGFSNPDLLWLSQSAISVELHKTVTARRTSLRLSDHYEGFGHSARVSRALRGLESRVDVLFASARTLIENLDAETRARAVFLPNGVEFARFEQATPSSRLERYPEPRVIYVGTIDWWFDHSWLEEVASALSHVSFLIAGPDHGNAMQGKRKENVHALGPVPYEEVPDLLAGCSAGIIPFKPNALTHSVNPIKLYEYAAVGLETVATELRELELLREYDKAPVISTNDSTKAASLLNDAIERGKSEKNRNFARDHDWKLSVAQLLDHVA